MKYNNFIHDNLRKVKNKKPIVMSDIYEHSFSHKYDTFNNSEPFTKSSLRDFNDFSNKSQTINDQITLLNTENFNFINDVYDISKKNLECDIKIASLKKKLAKVKEERKKSEYNVNIMKHKIIQLQNEEKNSIRRLEYTRKRINKIYDNRKRILNRNTNNNYSSSQKKRRWKGYSVRSSNLSLKSFLGFNRSKTPLDEVNSSRKTINYANTSNKKNYNPLNNSAKSNSSTSKIRTEKLAFNKNEKIRSQKIILRKINVDSLSGKKSSKKDLKENNISNTKNKLKQDLINKVNEQEEEKKRIQRQIEEIEKEQVNLFNSFNEDMNNYKSSIDNNFNSIDNNRQTVINDGMNYCIFIEDLDNNDYYNCYYYNENK